MNSYKYGIVVCEKKSKLQNVHLENTCSEIWAAYESLRNISLYIKSTSNLNIDEVLNKFVWAVRWSYLFFHHISFHFLLSTTSAVPIITGRYLRSHRSWCICCNGSNTNNIRGTVRPVTQYRHDQNGAITFVNIYICVGDQNESNEWEQGLSRAK